VKNILDMKNSFHLLIAFSFIIFQSCGGEDTIVEEKEAAIEIPKGMVQIDIKSSGFPLLIVVPDTSQKQLIIKSQDWGETYVSVGSQFQLKIAEGGDMALKKSDLNEDLLYKATILEDGGEYIYYKQEIEGGNVTPAFHFYMVKNIGGVWYEIQDNSDEETFGEASIEKMLEAVKLTSLMPANS
jgi:hypothetical protein